MRVPAVPPAALSRWLVCSIGLSSAIFTNDGGALDFFIDNAHIDQLFPGKNYTREKFTYQMSDHLPVWIQIKTDIDGFRLNQIVQDGKN